MKSTLDAPELEAHRELERFLKALANVNRLRLLEELQTPQGYGDLDLPPSRIDEQGDPGRAITRQALRRHVEELMGIGVVIPVSSSRGGAMRFTVDRARLYGIVEQLRKLATVEPEMAVPHGTVDLSAPPRADPAPGPHVVLVRGVHEGRTFPLERGREEWLVGRSRATPICLDYDPYISGTHARILRKDDGFVLADLPGNKNGTYLNWTKLERGGFAPLKSGDILGLGTSLLVFRA